MAKGSGADILLTVGIDTSQLRASMQNVNGELKKSSSAMMQQQMGMTKTNKTSKAAATANKKLAGEQKKVTDQQNKLAQSNQQMGSSMGKTMSRVMLWAPLWMIAYGALRMVQNAISNVGKVYAELSNEMGHVMSVTRTMGESQVAVHDSMRTAVINYAKESRESFSDIAKVLYHLGSAGLNVQEQLSGFQAVVELNTATLGKMDQTARLVAGAYNVFGKSMGENQTISEKFVEISDILAYTYSTQQVELTEISAAFGYVASAAGILDINLMSLIGTIGFLNTQMLKGSKAGTSLLNAFLKMAQKTDILKEKFGIVFDPSEPLDFNATMQKLHESLGQTEMSARTLRDLFGVFGIRGGRAIATILNDWNEWQDAIGATESTYEDFAKTMADTMEKTLPGAWAKYTNEIKAGMQEAFSTQGDWFTAHLTMATALKKEARDLKKEWENLKDFTGETGDYGPTIIPGHPLQQIDEYKKAIFGIRDALGASAVEARFLSDILTAPELQAAVDRQNRLKLFGATDLSKGVDLTETFDLVKDYPTNLKNKDAIVEKWAEDLKKVHGIQLKLNEMDPTWVRALIDMLSKKLTSYEKEKEVIKEVAFADQVAVYSAQKKYKYKLLEVGGLAKEDILQAKINDWLEKQVASLGMEVDREEAIRALSEYKTETAKELVLIGEQYGVGVADVLELEKLRLDYQKEHYAILMKEANIFKTEIVDGIMAANEGTEDWLGSLKSIGDQINKIYLEKFIQKNVVEKLWPAPENDIALPDTMDAGAKTIKDGIIEGGETAADAMKKGIIEGTKEAVGFTKYTDKDKGPEKIPSNWAAQAQAHPLANIPGFSTRTKVDIAAMNEVVQYAKDKFPEEVADLTKRAHTMAFNIGYMFQAVKDKMTILGSIASDVALDINKLPIVSALASSIGLGAGAGAVVAKQKAFDLGEIIFPTAEAAELPPGSIPPSLGLGLEQSQKNELPSLDIPDLFSGATEGIFGLSDSVIDLANKTYDGADGISELGTGLKDTDEIFGLLNKDAKKSKGAFESMGDMFDKAGGIGGVAGAGMGLYSASQGAGGIGGGLTGAMSGAQLGSMIMPGIGTAIGAIAGGILGFLGKKDKKDEAGKEQTIRVTSKIDVTNKELQMVNRNLVGIRRGFEGYIMPESAYFRERNSTESRFQLSELRGLQ